MNLCIVNRKFYILLIVLKNTKFSIERIKKMRWPRKVQKLGRIQIPTDYLNSYNIKEGHKVLIEDSDKPLTLKITFKKEKTK